MNERNFCFWLDGYLKSIRMKNDGYPSSLSKSDVSLIEDKLEQCLGVQITGTIEQTTDINNVLIC